ncbi:MAG: ion transporter [Puniceicoccales bacterium]|jgi:voltage-gated sodium channel|nr:ion transporter [Puniceicoccales bacterium]
MPIFKQFCQRLTTSRPFELVIMLVIIVNTVLIGLDPLERVYSLWIIQRIALAVFTAEILLRFIGRKSIKSFFTDGWNLFDLTLVLVGWMPEMIFEGSQQMIIFRSIRAIRVLRLLRVTTELRMISIALLKSFRSLFYNAIFFFSFMYLFAILGTILFKLPEKEDFIKQKMEEKTTEPLKTPEEKRKFYEAQYDAFVKEDPNGYAGIDPFGTVPEAMFSLFRVSTGDDWTVIRYSSQKAYKYGLIHAGDKAITAYHVTWFTLSVFLILNLLLGAIVNNCETAMEEIKKKKEEEEKEETKQQTA